MERADWENAERYFADAVRLDKNNPTLRLYYGDTLWQRGQREESLKQLREASRLSKGRDANIQSSLAAKLWEVGQVETALQCAETATQLAPHDARGWLLMGRICVSFGEKYQSYGRPDEAHIWLVRARDSYYRAAAQTNDKREILPELASLQMRLGQPEYALASWQSLQESYAPGTEPAAVLCGKGAVLAAMNRFPDSLDCYRLAFEREPENAAHQQFYEQVRLAAHQAAQRQ